MKEYMTICLAGSFLPGLVFSAHRGASPKKSENDDSGCRALHDPGLCRSE